MVDLSDTLSRKNAVSGKKEDSSAGNSNTLRKPFLETTLKLWFEDRCSVLLCHHTQ